MGVPLSLVGWKPIERETLESLTGYKRIIFVYAHTSKWDFVIYGLYWMTHHEIRSHCKVLINPRHMNRWGWITQYLGGVKAAPRDSRNAGTTERIKESLEGKETFGFLISPKGSIDPNPWRTGYYHLAKDLDCYIVPVGFDYLKKRFVFKPGFKVEDMTFEETSMKCKEALRSITPLHPDCAEYPIDYSVIDSSPEGEAVFREVTPSTVHNETVFVASLLIILVVFLLLAVISIIWRNWNNQ